MITPEGTTLVFSGIASKRLSISPHFPWEITPDSKQQIWDEKFDQLLRLTRRITDAEKKLENLNVMSSSDKKSSIGQDNEGDVKVSRSVSLESSNKEQTDAGTHYMKCTNDFGKCSNWSPPQQKRKEISHRNKGSLYFTSPMGGAENTSYEGSLRSLVSDHGGYKGGNEHAKYCFNAPNNSVNWQYSMPQLSPMYNQGRILSAPWYTLSCCDLNPREVRAEHTDRVKYSAKKKKERFDENVPVLPETCNLTEDAPPNKSKTPDNDLKSEETSTEEDHKNKSKSRKARKIRF